ncbi:hypothetical protein FHW36_106410 [Chitinophaga polysaccharea]|uniref:Uncharacterized protein n=1 Tax=Chitinophaga polysaccharea TaxID=1293035 RepID=A0A561PM54_9BACT|nr:hypothetical protein [Chitinophaga polysaccharea]TWF39180.1 hypothetical protein FHW36_106410 [Chitinophaga polysaccharea]
MKLQGLVKVCAVMLFCLGNQRLLAQQLKLGTNPTLLDKNALLELNSDKQGFLLPRVIKTQILSGGALYGASEGMLVYITDDKALYLKKTTGWEKIDFSILTAGTGISITGNTISNDGVLSFNSRKGVVVPANGDYNLSQMGDVTITSPADKQILQYQGATSKWININSPFVDPSRKLMLQAGTGISSVAASPVGSDLSADRTWTINADNTNAIWNANQIQGKSILTTAPNEGDLLTFTGGNWTPKAAPAGGVTSVGLSLPSIFNVTIPSVTSAGTLTATLNTQNANLVFAGPAMAPAAVPTFRALVAADLPTNSTAYIQNTTTTQTASNFNISGNGVIGGTLTVKGLTPGSIPYVGTGDVISENNAQLFWDGTKSLLGIGTNTPVNKVEIAGPPSTTAPFSTSTSGLRLTNLATATPTSATSKVLSINSFGDVILTDNPATTNWLTGGNAATSTQFLGTTNAVDMVVKYNNKELFRGSRGQTAAESGGSDFSAYTLTLMNGATKFNGHPLIIRANGNDVLAFEDASGTPKWHWNILGGGLNFVETNVKDYRLFLQNGGNVGVGTNTPAALLDVAGTAKIGTGGTVLNGVYRAVNVNAVTTSIPNSTSVTTAVTFTVTGIDGTLGGNVIINPRFDFPFNLRLISSRVSADDTVTAIFVNTTGSAYSLTGTGKRFDITVIQ